MDYVTGKDKVVEVDVRVEVFLYCQESFVGFKDVEKVLIIVKILPFFYDLIFILLDPVFLPWHPPAGICCLMRSRSLHWRLRRRL